MANHQITHDIATEGAKVAFPAVVTGAHFIGLSLADWVAIVTLIYLFGSIGLLIPKYRYQFVQWRKSRKEKRERIE